MMNLLRDNWTAGVTVRTHPYRWASTAPGELLDIAVAKQLLDELPGESLQRRKAGPGSEKTYQNYSRELVGPGREDVDGLSPVWRRLVEELASGPYRTSVARLFEHPVVEALEVRLVRHAPGDWLGPHTDRPDKVFSHVIYLNPSWDETWGGCLKILGSPDPGSAVATVVPELGASALMVRSDNSWHQVSAVSPDQTRSRTSLLIHGL